MKRFLKILLFIIMLRILIFFYYTISSPIVTYRDFEIQNLSGTGIIIDTKKENGINEKINIKNGGNIALKIGKNNPESVIDFAIINKNYTSFSGITNKVRIDDIYSDNEIVVHKNQQMIVLNTYFPIYTKIIENHLKYSIIVKN